MKNDGVEHARETYEWLCSRIAMNIGGRPIPADDLDTDELVRCVKRLKLMVCEGELRKLG
jgi:hypothetical protein